MEMDFLSGWSMKQTAPGPFKKLPGEVTIVSTGMIKGAPPRGRRDFFPDEKGRRADKRKAVDTGLNVSWRRGWADRLPWPRNGRD